MKNRNSLIIIAIIVIALLIFIYCKFDGSTDDGGDGDHPDVPPPPEKPTRSLATPRWTMEGFSQEHDSNTPLYLTFSYDYSTTIYTRSETNFSVVVEKCDGVVCAQPTCGIIGTKKPTCDPSTDISGKFWDGIDIGGGEYIDDGSTDGGMTYYRVPITTDGAYTIGSYTSYVMAYLDVNTNIQSAPIAANGTIDITGPGGFPPGYLITKPDQMDKYYGYNPESIIFSWIPDNGATNDNFGDDDYTLTLTIMDITNSSPGTLFYQNVGMPSDTTSIAVGSKFPDTAAFYSGYFSVNIASVSVTEEDNIKPSTAVTFYVKLQAPEKINVTDS